MLTATLLGISLLGWAFIAYGVVMLAIGAFASWFIHGAEEPVATDHTFGFAEPESAADLDDWLAGDGPNFDFEIWKRPCASTKGAAKLATPDAAIHGGKP